MFELSGWRITSFFATWLAGRFRLALSGRTGESKHVSRATKISLSTATSRPPMLKRGKILTHVASDVEGSMELRARRRGVPSDLHQGCVFPTSAIHNFAWSRTFSRKRFVGNIMRVLAAPLRSSVRNKAVLSKVIAAFYRALKFPRFWMVKQNSDSTPTKTLKIQDLLGSVSVIAVSTERRQHVLLLQQKHDSNLANTSSS